MKNVLKRFVLEEEVTKGEIKQLIFSMQSDISYAIGHGQGCGHPIIYLEKKYPELLKEERKK